MFDGSPWYNVIYYMYIQLVGLNIYIRLPNSLKLIMAHDNSSLK